MLPRKYRLPAAIRLRHPLIIKSPYFLAKITRNDQEQSRFGFIVSKKIDKQATARNRIRRVFRSCIEEMREQVKDGYDMLFFLEKGIIEKKRETVYNEIQKVFTQKDLLK